MELFVALALLLVGFAFGRRHPNKKQKTPHEITVELLNLITQEGCLPMEYREICDTLQVYTKEERRLVFEELIKLVDEETLGISEEIRPRKLYCKRVNILA